MNTPALKYLATAVLALLGTHIAPAQQIQQLDVAPGTSNNVRCHDDNKNGYWANQWTALNLQVDRNAIRSQSKTAPGKVWQNFYLPGAASNNVVPGSTTPGEQTIYGWVSPTGSAFTWSAHWTLGARLPVNMAPYDTIYGSGTSTVRGYPNMDLDVPDALGGETSLWSGNVDTKSLKLYYDADVNDPDRSVSQWVVGVDGYIQDNGDWTLWSSTQNRYVPRMYRFMIWFNRSGFGTLTPDTVSQSNLISLGGRNYAWSKATYNGEDNVFFKFLDGDLTNTVSDLPIDWFYRWMRANRALFFKKNPNTPGNVATDQLFLVGVKVGVETGKGRPGSWVRTNTAYFVRNAP